MTVDGAARRVVDAACVFRGPGAEASAGRAAAATGARALTERKRTVIVAVDENVIARGDGRPARRLAETLLDRLGLSDHAVEVRLPEPDGGLPVSADRRAAREAIGRVAGRAVPPGPMQAERTVPFDAGERPLAPQHVAPSGDVDSEAHGGRTPPDRL